jgi:hypothetical protein
MRVGGLTHPNNVSTPSEAREARRRAMDQMYVKVADVVVGVFSLASDVAEVLSVTRLSSRGAAMFGPLSAVSADAASLAGAPLPAPGAPAAADPESSDSGWVPATQTSSTQSP